jgi:hypothetical protein
LTIVNKYRLYCNTETAYVYDWAESEPTTCPNNTAHSIDSTKTTIVEVQGKNPTSAEGVPLVDTAGGFNDSSLIFCLGNKTTTATSEVLVSNRDYVEQDSEAQRSVVSTSSQDSSGGSGAKVIRIIYLTSDYEEKYEDVTLNGTTRVATTASDIRFIQDLRVVQGASAAGALKVYETAAGAQNEFCGIGAYTTQAFFAHYYVPAGCKAYIVRWHATVDDEVKFKLLGRNCLDGTNLVDTILDLDNLVDAGITPPTRLSFHDELMGVWAPEKAYVRITAVPNQATSTTIRAGLVIWKCSG